LRDARLTRSLSGNPPLAFLSKELAMRFRISAVPTGLLLALLTLLLAGTNRPLSAQSVTAQAAADSATGLSISAPVRIRLYTNSEWLQGQVGETMDGCYLVLFFPKEPGDLPWAASIPPLNALEIAVDSTDAGYVWKPVSIASVTRSQHEHCRPRSRLISRRSYGA
jgi:hypothetical protein